MKKISLYQHTQSLTELSGIMFDPDTKLLDLVERASQENAWFTVSNIRQSLSALAQNLSNESIKQWTQHYEPQINQAKPGKTVGLILAGNIPLVGFHDILSVLLSGNRALIKPSIQDRLLIPYLLEMLIKIDPAYSDRILFAGQLKNMDAVIATGSNNSARYFDYYFGKYPHIIRKNRNSVAVLDGHESSTDFEALGKDVFSYFGLGCRNVSKLMIPEGYDFIPMLQSFDNYSDLKQHHKYANNLEYQLTLLLMNQVPVYSNDVIILTENRSYASPIGTLHYEYYQNKVEVERQLETDGDLIQCLVSRDGEMKNSIAFGQTQQPALWDYADNVDTMRFLLDLA